MEVTRSRRPVMLMEGTPEIRVILQYYGSRGKELSAVMLLQK